MFLVSSLSPLSSFFFFNDTATTEIYTLSLHDALPICSRRKTNKRKSKHSAMLRNKETRHRMFIGLLNILCRVSLFLSMALDRKSVQQECRDRSRMPSSA